MFAVSRKVESAFQSLLISYVDMIASFQVVTGHSTEDKPTPRIVVYCERLTPLARDERGVPYSWAADLKISTAMCLGDVKQEASDSIEDSLLKILLDLDDVLTRLNAPASGPDNRAVKGFGLVSLELQDISDGRSGEVFGQVLAFRAQVSLAD